MDALELLLNRHSCSQLIAPPPGGEVLANILQAGLRSPDHGGLTPWRFIISQAQGLEQLSRYFKTAAKRQQMSEREISKATDAPFRAPLIITVIAAPTAHAKVPASEQLLSAGCAVMAMQMAAQAQGFNGIWRTGWCAYDDLIKQQLGLSATEQIVGFLYLGTPTNTTKKIRQLHLADYVTKLV